MYSYVGTLLVKSSLGNCSCIFFFGFVVNLDVGKNLVIFAGMRGKRTYLGETSFVLHKKKSTKKMKRKNNFRYLPIFLSIEFSLKLFNSVCLGSKLT